MRRDVVSTESLSAPIEPVQAIKPILYIKVEVPWSSGCLTGRDSIPGMALKPSRKAFYLYCSITVYQINGNAIGILIPTFSRVLKIYEQSVISLNDMGVNPFYNGGGGNVQKLADNQKERCSAYYNFSVGHYLGLHKVIKYDGNFF